MTTILIKKKDTAGAPAAGDLTNAAGGAEIAVNTATKRIYSKDSGGTIIEMGTFPSSMAVQGALSATGATSLNGNVTLGDASADNITVSGTITSNLLFTDATYDIGASGANRPRDLFLSRNLTVGGTLTLAGGVNLNGNVTIGDASSDTLTINSTITSNLIFTDNTYDIGASGATRPRNLYLGTSAYAGGRFIVTGSSSAGTTDISYGSYSGGAWINSPTATNAYLATNGTGILKWNATTVSSNANFQFEVDGAYNIGASGASRPLNLYLYGSIVAGAGASFAGDVTISKTSGTSILNVYAGTSGTAKLTLTSGSVYGYTLQTDSDAALKFIRDTSLYMYQTNTTEQWFNSAYIYSSAGGSTGTVRSGFYMDGTNNQLLLYTNATVRLTVSSTGNSSFVASNAITLGSSSTYALLIGNNASPGDISLGSNGSNGFIQSWGGKQLYLQNQGNPLRLGSNTQVGVNIDGGGSGAGASMLISYHTTRTTSEHALQLVFNDSMNSGENVYMSFGQGSSSQLARIAGVYEGGSYQGGLYFYTNRNTDGANPQLSAKIDAAGRLSVPNNPSFLAIGAGYNGSYFRNQYIGNFSPANGGHNIGGNFSYIGSGGTGRFTAPVAGVYMLSAGALWYGTSYTNSRNVNIYVNGGGVNVNYSDGAIQPYSPNCTVLVYLNAGDYAQAYLSGTQDGWYDNGATAGNYGSSNYNWFCGRLMS